jgi:hypothetical protein
VRCGEAEVGVRFIGPGRRWGGGEAADGSAVLLLISFEGVKGGRGDGTTPIQSGSKGGMTMLRFGSSCTEEGDSWRRMVGWRDRRGGGADGSWRWEPMEAEGGSRRTRPKG